MTQVELMAGGRMSLSWEFKEERLHFTLVSSNHKLGFHGLQIKLLVFFKSMYEIYLISMQNKVYSSMYRDFISH